MGELRTKKRGKKWEYSFEGPRINGKRTSISKGGFRTKAEAVDAGTKAKAEYDSTGAVFRASDQSVSDYMDFWLEGHVKTHFAYNTYDAYETTIRLHIKPAFGSYKLSALTPAVIQMWIDDLKEKKGLSRQSIANFRGVLSSALNYAVYPCEFLKQNPCACTTVPKIAVTPERKAHTEYICGSEEWHHIEGYFRGTAYYLPLMICYHTGVRIGECFGIDFNTDIDFEKHTLSINRQLQKENGDWIYKYPKYHSIRTLRIGPTLEQAIRSALTAYRLNRLKYGRYYTRTYVDQEQRIHCLPADQIAPERYREIQPLVKENGEMLNTASIKYISRIIKSKLGYTLFHPHCLRHTHGTILAENGASPKTIMERLGHKNIQVTMERYVFNTEKMQEEAANIFESALSGSHFEKNLSTAQKTVDKR